MVDFSELQIDDLVGKAIRHKATSKNDMKEIESFAHVLSEMQNSLQVHAFVCVHILLLLHCFT